MAERFTFIVGGAEFALSRSDVERKLRNIVPENVRQVYVRVNEARYPVKQALAEAAGLLRSGFTTQDAVRVFRKLGLQIGEV